MSVAFKQMKVYFRLAIIVAVIIIIGVVLAMNRNHRATVWFFHKHEDIPVLWLLLMTAVGSVLSYWVLSRIFKVWREWRAVSKEAVIERRTKQLEERAQALDERESRIDEKVHQTLAEPPDSE